MMVIYLDPYTYYEYLLSANTSKGYGADISGTFKTDESGIFVLLL